MPYDASSPLRILVVTEDRTLLRQLSAFFDLIGYQALAAAEPETALAAVDALSPQVLLVDWDLAAQRDWQLCDQLTQRAPGLYKFLLVEEPDQSQLQEALEAGIDDFLLRPIGYGELLSRLRAAARVLEFDRRSGQQGRIDPLTGLLSRSALSACARSQLCEHPGGTPRVACVILDIDFSQRISRLHGPAAGDLLLKQFAQELAQLRTGSEIVGRVEGDCFAVLLPGATETGAAEWAQRARETLNAVEFDLDLARWQVTVSCGATGSRPADTCETLLERALAARLAAKRSGRNCVVTAAQAETDQAALVTRDKLFDKTLARDVMTPCTVFLQPHEGLRDASRIFRRTGLDSLIVIDAEGKFLGLLEQSHLADVAADDDSLETRDYLNSEVQTFEQFEPLTSLLAFFTQDARTQAVVLDAGRPVGIVTCGALVALSQPVRPGNFAPTGIYSDASRYLLVPDHVELECEPTA